MTFQLKVLDQSCIGTYMKIWNWKVAFTSWNANVQNIQSKSILTNIVVHTCLGWDLNNQKAKWEVKRSNSYNNFYQNDRRVLVWVQSSGLLRLYVLLCPILLESFKQLPWWKILCLNLSDSAESDDTISTNNFCLRNFCLILQRFWCSW
jgi:hypothetical protein